MRKIGLVVMSLSLVGLLFSARVNASDHDDGENDMKARALNITDVYLFREDWQTGDAGDADNLIVVMNTNPRSLPRQQYFFSTEARYEVHLSRVGDGAADQGNSPTGADDVVLRFTFGDPDATTKRQAVTIAAIIDGVTTTITETTGGGSIYTTPLAEAATPVSNEVEINGENIDVFAGLREDPFFFDVNEFFAVRGFDADHPPAHLIAPLNRPNDDPPEDFTRNYNVNSIVASVPIALLQANGETIFDAWATISVPTK